MASGEPGEEPGEEHPKRKWRRWPLQYFAALSASISEVIIGFVYGWSSSALPKLQEPSWPWPLSSDEASWVVSLVDIGSLLVSIPAGLAANRLGRKRVLLASAAFFLASWGMIIAANSAGWLYAARLLAGMGGGTVFTVNTMYWGEIASAGFRGSASSLTQAMLFLGVLLADVVDISPHSYHSLALSGVAVTLLFVLTFVAMPESPYFYLMRSRPDLAERALQRLRGREDVQAELEPLREAVQRDLAAGSDTQCGCTDMVRTRGARRAVLISVVIGALQRLAGLSAVIAYTSTTLPKSLAHLGPLLIGAVLFLASFGPLVLMDRLGRRPLLIISSVVVAVSMTSNGLYYHFKNNGHDVEGLVWVPVTGLMLYAVAYSLGMGPVPDILPGEVFPTSVKGLAVSAVNVSLTLFTFLVSKIYQDVSDSVGVQFMYWGFAVVGVLTALFAAFVMPETRGKTLEEVVAEMETTTSLCAHLPRTTRRTRPPHQEERGEPQ